MPRRSAASSGTTRPRFASSRRVPRRARPRYAPPRRRSGGGCSAPAAAPPAGAVAAHGPPRAPGGAVYADYPSGTTGRPTGPVSLRRGVVNRLGSMSRRYGCSAEDVVLVTSAPLFDAFVWQVFWPLLSGARAAFLGGAIEDVGIRRVVERLAEERATVTDFVPSVFNVLVGYLREAPERYEALRSLRQVLVGGERMSPAAVAELKRNLPHVGITNTYGATEASIGSVFHELSQRVDEEEDIPIGRPIDNTTAYVVDRHGELAPVGAIGEIQLGGACVGAGY